MMPVEVILNMVSLGGYINIDLNDLEAAINGPNKLAAVLSGTGQGNERTIEILAEMYESPYLSEIAWSAIETIIVCFESGAETEIQVGEIAEVMDSFQSKFGENPEVIWGNCMNTNLSDQIRVSAIVCQHPT